MTRHFTWIFCLLAMTGLAVWGQPIPSAADGERQDSSSELRKLPPPPPREGKVPPPQEKRRRHRLGRQGDAVIVLMSELKKTNPEEFQRLEQLRKTDRRAFFQEIRKRLPGPSETFAKLWENERECRELAQKLRQCRNEEEKKALLQQLKEKIETDFNLMIQETAQRLEAMQKHLDGLKENKEAVLQNRLEAFLQQP